MPRRMSCAIGCTPRCTRARSRSGLSRRREYVSGHDVAAGDLGELKADGVTLLGLVEALPELLDRLDDGGVPAPTATGDRDRVVDAYLAGRDLSGHDDAATGDVEDVLDHHAEVDRADRRAP